METLPEVRAEHPQVKRVVHSASIYGVLHQSVHEVPLRLACDSVRVVRVVRVVRGQWLKTFKQKEELYSGWYNYGTIKHT